MERYLRALEIVGIGPIRSVMLPQPDLVDLVDCARLLNRVYQQLGFLPLTGTKQETIETHGYDVFLALEEIARR